MCITANPLIEPTVTATTRFNQPYFSDDVSKSGGAGPARRGGAAN